MVQEPYPTDAGPASQARFSNVDQLIGGVFGSYGISQHLSPAPEPQYQPAPEPQYDPAPQPQYDPAPEPQHQGDPAQQDRWFGSPYRQQQPWHTGQAQQQQSWGSGFAEQPSWGLGFAQQQHPWGSGFAQPWGQAFVQNQPHETGTSSSLQLPSWASDLASYGNLLGSNTYPTPVPHSGSGFVDQQPVQDVAEDEAETEPEPEAAEQTPTPPPPSIQETGGSSSHPRRHRLMSSLLGYHKGKRKGKK